MLEVSLAGPHHVQRRQGVRDSGETEMKCTVKTLGWVAALSLVIACGDAAKPASEAGASKTVVWVEAEEKAAENEGKISEGEASVPGGEASAATIGIAECDEYVEKQGACISKYPEAAQATARELFQASIRAWKGLAVEGPAREQVVQLCKFTLEAARQQGAAYGCEFDP